MPHLLCPKQTIVVKCNPEILILDIKNWESAAPFAFIQFTDIQSVARAISACSGSSANFSGGKGKIKVSLLLMCF